MCSRRALLVVEARDVGRLQVDLRLAVHHPLGHRLADARPLLHPDGGRRPQALHLGRLAEQRQAVRRQRQQAVDRVLDADRLVAEHLRDELERVLELELEVLLRERQLGRRERRLLDRRDLVGLVEDRPVRVRADLEPLPVLALVHVRVHVADDRELDRGLRGEEARHRADVDHLVHRRRQRDRRAGHARDARAQMPHAITTVSASTSPRVVRTRRTRPSSTSMPEHLGVREHLSAPAACARSRMIVPKRSESTTATDGRVEAAERGSTRR